MDTILPTLTSITVLDPNVDLTAGDNNVTFRLESADDESGVASIKVTIADPEGKKLSKTLNAGSGDLTFTLSDSAPGGNYKVTEVVVTDIAGNARTYNGPNLSSFISNNILVENPIVDDTPPTLVSFTIDNPVIDYSTGDRSFTVNFKASDDLSGVKTVNVFFYVGQQQASYVFYGKESGSHTFTLPDYINNGDYEIYVAVRDVANNHFSYWPKHLDAAGLPSSFTVTGSEIDTQAPQLTSLALQDSSINFSDGDTAAVISFNATDDLAGVKNVSFWLIDPSGHYYKGGMGSGVNVAGNLNFTSKVTIPIDPNVLTGTWSIEAQLYDYVGNKIILSPSDVATLGLPSTFTVTDGANDVTPPTLVSLSILDPVVDFATGDRDVTISIKLSDDISGVYYTNIVIENKSYALQNISKIYFNEKEILQKFNIPEHYRSGEYTIEIITNDNAGNQIGYIYDDLIKQGFSASFEVIADDDGGHDDNGHGNDDDGYDESNPGNSTGTHRVSGTVAADILNGSAGDDEIEAGDADDTVWAGKNDVGNDKVYGGHGNDMLGGGRGNDLLVGDAAKSPSTVIAAGDDGADTLYGADGDDTLIAGGWNDADANGVFDAAEIDDADTSPNILWGGKGGDHIFGASGDDTLAGGIGDDTIVGGNGNDVVFGGRGDDIISGGDGNDLLYNGLGDDQANGGNGDDTLMGSQGDDTLIGGDGSDRFIFDATNGSQLLLDFESQSDRLDLTAFNLADFAELKAAATQVGSAVQILLGDTSIILEGVNVASFDQLNIEL